MISPLRLPLDAQRRDAVAIPRASRALFWRTSLPRGEATQGSPPITGRRVDVLKVRWPSPGRKATATRPSFALPAAQRRGGGDGFALFGIACWINELLRKAERPRCNPV